MLNYDNIRLELINDDELELIFLKLRGKINESKRKKIRSKNLEIYYCYVVRELERRKYVSDLPRI